MIVDDEICFLVHVVATLCKPWYNVDGLKYVKKGGHFLVWLLVYNFTTKKEKW